MIRAPLNVIPAWIVQILQVCAFGFAPNLHIISFLALLVPIAYSLSDFELNLAYFPVLYLFCFRFIMWCGVACGVEMTETGTALRISVYLDEDEIDLFVAVITNTFSAIREETHKSTFGAAP